jgi:DNA repair exonuclease SbcCD ATPase subunit
MSDSDDRTMGPAENEAEQTTPEVHPETERRRFYQVDRDKVNNRIRAILRGALIVLIIFSLGALLILIGLYLPVKGQLDSASLSLEQANQTIEEQQAQIEALETAQAELESDLSSKSRYAALLDVEIEVYEARLAVMENNLSRATLSLNQAERAISRLEQQLDGQQSAVLNDLKNKLSQARSKAEGNLRSALADLVTISGDLAKLKESLLQQP